MEPGAFAPYNRRPPAPGVPLPDGVEHATVQFSAPGYPMSLPCPEGPGWPALGVVGREEVNLLGRGTREGRNVWIVGETKARVDLRTGRKGDLDLFGHLERKVAAVREAYGEVELSASSSPTSPPGISWPMPTERRGVLVIQSFEW